MTTIDETLGEGLRILVVDDSADAAVTMAMVLRQYGHQVDTAASGYEALDKIDLDCPDAVILDIGLPGMSGYDVAKAVAAHRPHKTPLLIAVSGYAREEDRRFSREAGIHVHLAKPADPLEVKAILERFGRALTVVLR